MDRVLIDEVSPNGNVTALAEESGQCVYFYLHGAPETEFGVRSCWVRNLGAAPADLDLEAMRSGKPPMLPAGFCRHPGGARPLDSDRLRIVWFEEGDAAALLENDEILAVIPGWSGFKGFPGYARDCTGENPLCWSLGSPDSNALFARVAEAEAFWASWEGSNPWPAIQEGIFNALERSIGPSTNYYSVDGGEWPPRAIVRMVTQSAVVAVTCGMSIRPQPRFERDGDNAEWRRIELGIAVGATQEADVRQVFGKVARACGGGVGVGRFAGFLQSRSGRLI